MKTMEKASRSLMRKLLALCFALMLLAPAVQLALGQGAQAQGVELALEQTTPEGGFLLIPGVAIPQDITVQAGKSSGSSYVYVQIKEQNNTERYLTYQVAEGWLPLFTPDGEQIPGVYYRSHDDSAAAAWPVLANEQIMVNPETATWPVINRLAQDSTGASWPSLSYEAFGLALEEAGDLVSAYEGWSMIHGSEWDVKYEQAALSAGVSDALNVADGLTAQQYAVTLQDENGCHMQPFGSVEVRLPVAEDADAAIVLHELENDSSMIDAINAGRAVALRTGSGKSVIAEVLDAEVEGGYAVFETTGFSTYYVVSGHGSTLKNWWETTQTTRYNFDQGVYGLDENATDTRNFVVEPDSSFYIYLDGERSVNGQTQVGPFDGTWTVESNNSDNRIMITTAGDGLGRVVSVSADAQSGDKLVFKANNWTVTVTVMQDVVAETYNNADYPVYIGITLDASTISIGNEPRVSGYDNNAWVYVTGMTGNSVTVNGGSGAYEQHKTVAPVAGSVGANYLTEAITTVTMLENTDSKHVRGIIDNTLDTTVNGAIDIDPYIRNIDWNGIKAVLLADSSISSQLKATDGIAVNSTPGKYELVPYVVKIQTGNFIGWHINACFVPVSSSDGWIYFDENLDESLGQEIEFLNVPARRPWNGGKGTTASPYYVNPGQPGSNYVKISVSEYVTLTNGQKLRFMGWNTMEDGSGDMYSGEGGVFDSPNSKTKFPLVANGTLYAFWDSPLDRLEIHKELLIDEGQDDSGRYKTDFTFTVELTLPGDLEIDSDMKIIAEEFYVADDSLVDNSQQSIGLQGTQRNYTITFTFNEDQYGVIYAPKGTTYTVTETLPSGNDYKLVGSQNTTGKIEGVGEGSIVRFTNGWKNTTGLLRVSKQIAADSQTEEGWADLEFPITIALTAPDGVTDPTYTYQIYDRQNNPFGDPITTTESAITLNLSHNESVVFTGVKEGTAYTVTETVPADSLYTPVKNELIGSVVANATQEAAVVNQIVINNGALSITKTVVNTTGVTPAVDEFTFTVTLTDADNKALTDSFNYKIGETAGTIASGGTITLTAGQTAIIEELPADTQYTVTETVPTGYVASQETTTGTIKAGETAEVEVTNTFKVADLVITKSIVNADANSANDVFTFEVVLDGESQTVTITGASSATIENIPINTEYTVTETGLPTGYTISGQSNTSGVIAAGTNQVTFTNTNNNGALNVTKTVVNTTGVTPAVDEFTFNVTIGEKTQQITLKHGETQTFSEIPAGTQYTVTETVPTGYVASAVTTTGTIEAGETAEVEVTNTFQVADLVITKSIVNADANSANDVFTFEVVLDGKPQTVTITGAGSETIKNIPINTEYTVTETGLPTGYTISGQSNTSGVIAAGTNQVAFTNTNNNGALSITKTVVNTTGVTPAVDEFTFNVTIGEKTQQITLKHGETRTFSEIPAGTQYTVTETVPTGYVASAETTTGTIKAGKTAEVEVTNTFKVADLTVTKSVVDPSGTAVTDNNIMDDVFTFEVMLDGESQTVTITGAGSATIENIPINTEYTVRETGLPTGYTISGQSNTSGVIAAGTNQVAFTNTYSTGTLTISKTVIGADAPADAEFEFTVNLYADAAKTTVLDGSYACVIGERTIQVSNGSKLTLKHNETATISNLPDGAIYEVTETDVSALYEMAASGNTGVIDAAAPQAAAFTNTYKTASLTITKSGIEAIDHHAKNGTNEEERQSSIFRVQGVANTATAGIDLQVVICGNGSTTLTQLPVGDYTVTEVTDWAWRYEPTGGAVKSVEVHVTNSNTVVFKNVREEIYWLNGDSYAENNFDAYQN